MQENFSERCPVRLSFSLAQAAGQGSTVEPYQVNPKPSGSLIMSSRSLPLASGTAASTSVSRSTQSLMNSCTACSASDVRLPSRWLVTLVPFM